MVNAQRELSEMGTDQKEVLLYLPAVVVVDFDYAVVTVDIVALVVYL
jgi:hypothetical protein